MSKKVICVQDLSCFGKCSLTITMPVLACAGIEVVPLPTALLSTHTGGLGHPYIHDLSREIKAIRAHWKTLSLPIHVLYCGYVSDLAQLAQIQALIKQYPHAYRFVDPVMGDHGRLYASLPKDLPHAMRSLCQSADCITPNMTEAYALLQEPFQAGPYSDAQIKNLLQGLARLTNAVIVLKGIYQKDDELGCAIMEQGKLSIVRGKRLPYQYHGTGDLFAAALLGAYTQKIPFIKAVQIAMEFTYQCMEYSKQSNEDERFGLHFEPCLSTYIEQLKQAVSTKSIM